MGLRAGLTLVIGLGIAMPATAVIARTVALKDVLAAEQFIFTARIEAIRGDPMQLTLRIGDELKGKAPKSPLIIRLTGDAAARREQQLAKLLERIAENTDLVVFGSVRGSQATLFAFSNGTWFQIVGGGAEGYTFTHLEPYLRRTFRGTTPELKQVVIDGLSGRKAPPAPSPDEPPGLGPVLVKSPGGSE